MRLVLLLCSLLIANPLDSIKIQSIGSLVNNTDVAYVISEDMISRSNAHNLSELLDLYVPSFVKQYNKWNGQVWGMNSVISDQNDKVLVLINGVRLNYFSLYGFHSELELNMLGDVTRIEILKGGGILYGTSAMAGVINIVTKQDTYFGGSLDFQSRTIEAGSVVEKDGTSVAVSVGSYSNSGLPRNSVLLFGRFEQPSVSGNIKHYDTYTAGRLGLGNSSYASVTLQNKKATTYFRYSETNNSLASYWLINPWISIKGGYWGNDSVIYGGKVYTKSQDTLNINNNKQINWGGTNFLVKKTLLGKYTYSGLLNPYVEYVLNSSYMTSLIRKELFDPDQIEAVHEIQSTWGESQFTNSAILRLDAGKVKTAFGIEQSILNQGDDFSDLNFEVDATTNWEQDTRHKAVTPLTYYNTALFTETQCSLDGYTVLAGIRLDNHTRGMILSPRAIVQSKHWHLSSQFNNNFAYSTAYDPIVYDSLGKPRFEAPYAEMDSNGVNSYGAKVKVILPVNLTELHSLKPEKSLYSEIGTSFYKTNVSVGINYLKDLFGYDNALQRVNNVGGYTALLMEVSDESKLGRLTINSSASYTSILNMDAALVRKVPIYKAKLADSVLVSGKMQPYYVPIATDSFELVKVETMRDRISHDGYSFNDIPLLMWKQNLAYENKIGAYLNYQVWYGLFNRLDQLKQYEVEDKYKLYYPILKASSGISYTTKYGKITLGIDNWAGWLSERNKFRWQQQIVPSQMEYYSVDIPTYFIQFRSK